MTSTISLLIVVVLSSLFSGDVALKLKERDRAIIDWITSSVEKAIPIDLASQMKSLLKDEKLSPDCKTVVQECINQKAQGNCKEDVKDCAADVFFGPTSDPKYSDMGRDMDLPGIMQEAANEIALSSGTAVAKTLLRECLSYQKNTLLTAFEGLFLKKDAKLTPQEEFLCRALTGKDVGTFPDLLTAPLQCSTFDDEKSSCKDSVGHPTITDVFDDIYQKIFQSAGLSVPPNLDFRTCWAQQERPLCIAALWLGRTCYPACKVADCVYTQLKKSDVCAANLVPGSSAFFQSASKQCEKLAASLKVTGIHKCKDIETTTTTTTTRPVKMASLDAGTAATENIRVGLAGVILYLFALGC